MPQTPLDWVGFIVYPHHLMSAPHPKASSYATAPGFHVSQACIGGKFGAQECRGSASSASVDHARAQRCIPSGVLVYPCLTP